MTERALWTPAPDRMAASNLARFMAPLGFTTFEQVLRYSVDEPEAFFSHPRHERTKLFLSQILR